MDVRDTGFEYDGKLYKSLSSIAREVTGTRWNGFAFFGLVPAKEAAVVGSGVIEAGCKTIIGSRCKQSGMFWTVRGANAILALRCCYFNGRFEDYWEARRAA